MRKNILIAIVLIVILAAVLIWGPKKNDTTNTRLENPDSIGTVTPGNDASSGSPVVGSSREVEDIRSKVLNFGMKLKLVSTLAADFGNQIQAQYSPYIAPALLAKWKADPATALGRNVSTPSPDRIEIVSLTKQDADTYKVEGNVIEVGADSPKTLAMYPVTLIIKNDQGSWLITEATKGEYSRPPEEVSFDGTYECLPHRNPSGPQTMECAFGIKVDTTGKHYALDASNVQSSVNTIATNKRIHVEGTLVPTTNLNSDMWQKYAIEGIIALSSIKQL